MSEINQHEHEHNHNHNHNHEHEHNKPIDKKDVILWSISVLLFIVAMIANTTSIPPYFKALLFSASAVLAGYDLFIDGIKELFTLHLEENSLLLIAVVASFILLEFPEACVVTILFKLGSFLENYAVTRSRKNMDALTKIRPDFATVKNANGEYVAVKAEDISVGDVIFLRAGDKAALDCEIISGNSSMDSSALTGESLPVNVKSGDTVLSGTINLSGLLEAKVIKNFENSTASQIIKMVYDSTAKKGKAENIISRFAKIYTPIVIVCALIIAVAPPLLSLGTFNDFIMRSLIFLVAACPCSLVISIPLSFFSAIGAASKNGILIKGSMYLETLSKINTVCLDKTGTITSGKLMVDRVVSLSNKFDEKKILSIAKSIEENSVHPIAKSIVDHFINTNKTANNPAFIVEEVQEKSGIGISCKSGGNYYFCGGINMLKAMHISTEKLPDAPVYICENTDIIGYITLTEDIPKDSLTLVKNLQNQNINRVVMLTGDNQKSAENVASKCKITEFYSGLLPADKVEQVKKIKQNGGTVLFLGDGINDAPVIAAADLGMSMGLGSEIANSSSDIILASNNLSALPRAISLSKHCMSVVYFNLFFAIIVKLIVLILGALGLGSMWLAVFADIGVTILSVLNAVRLLKSDKKLQ